MNSLVQGIDASDAAAALAAFDAEAAGGSDPWELHLALFPAAQRVLNPPFINPHLPKMHAICRELAPLLAPEDLAPLVRLELSEFARRPKLPLPPEKSLSKGAVWEDVLASLQGEDAAETARLMASLCGSAGWREFSRRMLLLGSGYLKASLGHSVSCTAFILLEGMERADADPWPVFVTLADYFHKGKFDAMPERDDGSITPEEYQHHLLRAAGGGGIVPLHDTITMYAVERVWHLFDDEEEHRHLLHCWIDYLGEKETVEVRAEPAAPPAGYEDFSRAFSSLEPARALSPAAALLETPEGSRLLVSYLLKQVCDRYRPPMNPHHLTGLGSLLWLAEQELPRRIKVTALHQYLDYLFGELRKE